MQQIHDKQLHFWIANIVFTQAKRLKKFIEFLNNPNFKNILKSLGYNNAFQTKQIPKPQNFFQNKVMNWGFLASIFA